MSAARAATWREPVLPNDAVWLQDTPTNLMVINGVYTTDHITLDEVRDVFRTRVIEPGGGARYPRFRHRLARVRGRWFWEEDPDFDIARHIVASEVTGPVTTADLQAYIARHAAEPLPDDRPRWRIIHFEHFEDGGSAFVVRVHHAMADGIAMVPILFSLMDESGPGAPAAVVPARSMGGRLRTLVLAPLLGPLVLLERVVWSPDRHALHGRKVSGQKRVAWTRPLPIEVVKQVKDRLGATVNDVLMAVVSGGLGRYLETHAGEARPPHFRVSMPVNMRSPGEALRMENRFAAVPLTLAAAPATLRERVAAVKVQMDALKQGLEPLVIYGVVKVFLTTMPQFVSRRLIDFFANKCTSVVTNVPGPQGTLTMAGRKLRTLMFWVPQRAEIGVGVSILSFGGQVVVGVIADTELLPDPAALVGTIEQEFDELGRI